MRTSKALAIGFCLVGILACWLMWHEAGLPPANRPMRLFGASGGKGITSEVYPESSIVFSGGICVITILGVLGLIGREDNSPEWYWGLALIAVGVLLGVFLHQARRVNGTDLAVVQPGHLLGLLAGGGIVASGVLVLVVAWRAARRTRSCS